MRSSLALWALSIGLVLITVLAFGSRAPQLNLAFTGDVMLGRDVAATWSGAGWSSALAAIAPNLSGADLAFINLESPLSNKPFVGTSFDLRAPPDAIRALQTAGIDIASLANNHAMDAGVPGLKQTQIILKSAGIDFVGADQRSITTSVKGLKITWFGLDDTTKMIDTHLVEAEIAHAAQHADLIIVSIHWGNEWEPGPNTRQHAMAEALAAAGADIILGHHPHVLQPIEWIWGAGRGRPTLIAYSLGNALFDQESPPDARLGIVLNIRAGRSGVLEACVIPFELDTRGWRVTPAGGMSIKRILRRLNFEPGTSIQICQNRMRY